MKHIPWILIAPLALLLAGCASVFPRATTGIGTIPCTYRFKMLTRPEDRARVEAAINSVAAGPVTKSGTLSYPEYHFRVARLADLDSLTPKILYKESSPFLAPSRQQALNLRAAGVDFVFDSTDVSASATTTITFSVKPGSRLYYKNPGGVETDITAKVGKNGKVSFPASIQEGQRYLHARAVKDNVTRYIRINIFSNEVRDIPKREY